jgi:hypothetical protein
LLWTEEGKISLEVGEALIEHIHGKRTASQSVSLHNNLISYVISLATSGKKSGTLLDRGANAGFAGNNVTVIYKTGSFIDCKGLDNHMINDYPKW